MNSEVVKIIKWAYKKMNTEEPLEIYKGTDRSGSLEWSLICIGDKARGYYDTYIENGLCNIVEDFTTRALDTKEYEIQEYKTLFGKVELVYSSGGISTNKSEKHKCNCPLDVIMCRGCICGGV